MSISRQIPSGSPARAALLAPIALLAQSAAAQLHSGDIILRMDGGIIQTGEVVGAAPVFGARIFNGEFGKFGIPSSTSDPGFDSATGAFPVSRVIGLTLRKALRAWDGTDFDRIPAERLDVSKSTTIRTPEVDPGLCVPGPGLNIGRTNPSGKIHEHPGWTLTAPAADGIYLVEFELWMTAAGTSTSRPVWIVFSQNADTAELTRATDFARRVLTCIPDLNRDGQLDVSDFAAFQNAFALGAAEADLNSDCTLDVQDFAAFQNAFALGCP